METSHIALYQGLTFLAVATGIIFVVVGAFLVKLIFDLSKLTRNVDETTTIVKTEIEPTMKELHKALESINSIAQNADKQVDTLAKTFETVLGAGAIAFTKAKTFSGGLVKGVVKGVVAVTKAFMKK
jgi:uncharacterized protein YoxC